MRRKKRLDEATVQGIVNQYICNYLLDRALGYIRKGKEDTTLHASYTIRNSQIINQYFAGNK